MKTYTELTETERKEAFNYHLNSLIPAMDILDDLAPEAKSWSNLESEVVTLTPVALANAQTSRYCCTSDGTDPTSGIFPIVFV